MVYTYGDSAEYELDSLFSIGMLDGISIELKDIPRNNGWMEYIIREDGIITLDIKSNPRKRLKNALSGVVLFSPENQDYIFGYYSVMDREKESKVDALVERIISEPFSPLVEEVSGMIEDAEEEYMKRFGGEFRYH